MPFNPLRPDPEEVRDATRLAHSAKTSVSARLAKTDSGLCLDSIGGAHPFRVETAGGRLLSRRNWLSGLAVGTALGWPKVVRAGATHPIALETLVRESHHVLVGTPRVGDSVWEESDGNRRIVTYTRVTIDELLDGGPSDSEVMVRTLGGQVGPLGQVVHGEAELEREKTCVLFLRARGDGAFRVTALAQGHYPLLQDKEGTRRLTTSPRLADFFGADASSAVARLRGQSVERARVLVQEAQRAK